MIAQGYLEESDERTVSPFAAVIAEYRRHAAKLAVRPARPNSSKAAFYYISVANALETL